MSRLLFPVAPDIPSQLVVVVSHLALKCETFWSCFLHCPCLFRRSPGMLFAAVGFSFASPSLRFVKQVSGEEPYSNTSRSVRLS